MAAVHRGGGANAGQLGESDGLALVLQIAVFRNGGFALEERLKHHHGCCFEPGGVKSEQHIHRAAGLIGGERGLRGHLLVVHQQRFAGLFVH